MEMEFVNMSTKHITNIITNDKLTIRWKIISHYISPLVLITM